MKIHWTAVINVSICSFHFKGLGSSAWLLHMHGWNQSGWFYTSYRPGIRALRVRYYIVLLADCHFKTGSTANGSWFWAFFIRYSFFPLPTIRLPYHTLITKEKLEKIQKAEQLLYENGFPVVVNRVRMHDTIARIEIPSEQFFTFIKSDLILL